MYNSLYRYIGENFKEYLSLLEFNEIQNIDLNLRSNGWGIMSINEIDNGFDLMKFFYIFYYLNGRFPCTNSLLTIPDGDKSSLVLSKKNSLKRLYEMFCGTSSLGLASIQFLAALNLFF